MTEGITTDTTEDAGARKRAIEAYEDARDYATDTLGQAPLLALAGGIAAGALIAALLPRTDAETRAIRPTARRVKQTAKAAFDAARGTGSQRLDDLASAATRQRTRSATYSRASPTPPRLRPMPRSMRPATPTKADGEGQIG